MGDVLDRLRQANQDPPAGIGQPMLRPTPPPADAPGLQDPLADPLVAPLVGQARLGDPLGVSGPFLGPDIELPALPALPRPSVPGWMEPDIRYHDVDQDGTTDGVTVSGQGPELEHVPVTTPSAGIAMGSWEEEDGSISHGYRGGVSGIALQDGDARHEFVGANLDAWAGENEARLGAGFTLAQASVDTRHFSADDTSENHARVGFNESLGLGARAHYGDEDGDGVREMGFGFDLGSWSVDVESEDLGAAVQWLAEHRRPDLQ